MNEKWKDEYDARQYARMLEQLGLFENHKLDLPELIKNLRALMTAFEEPDDAWIQKFKGEWWTLEQIYASSLDKEEKGEVKSYKEVMESLIYQADISAALHQMKMLLQTKCYLL